METTLSEGQLVQKTDQAIKLEEPEQSTIIHKTREIYFEQELLKLKFIRLIIALNEKKSIFSIDVKRKWCSNPKLKKPHNHNFLLKRNSLKILGKIVLLLLLIQHLLWACYFILFRLVKLDLLKL